MGTAAEATGATTLQSPSGTPVMLHLFLLGGVTTDTSVSLVHGGRVSGMASGVVRGSEDAEEAG